MFYAVYSNASCIRVQYSIVEYNRVIAWKVSKYRVFSGWYFPTFGPEKTSYLDTFHAVFCIGIFIVISVTIIKISFSRVEYMLHFIFLQNIFCFNGKHGNDLSEYAKCL